jgi:hypothetical protein
VGAWRDSLVVCAIIAIALAEASALSARPGTLSRQELTPKVLKGNSRQVASLGYRAPKAAPSAAPLSAQSAIWLSEVGGAEKAKRHRPTIQKEAMAPITAPARRSRLRMGEFHQLENRCRWFWMNGLDMSISAP